MNVEKATPSVERQKHAHFAPAAMSAGSWDLARCLG